MKLVTASEAAAHKVGQTPMPIPQACPPAVPLFPQLPTPAGGLLQEIVEAGLFNADRAGAFLAELGHRVKAITNRERMGNALVQLGYLTEYQRLRALGGQLFGMVFGQYIVRDRLGGGTVGVVLKAEHAILGTPVAIKLLVESADSSSNTTARFLSEVKALAKISHRHVVGLRDTGDLRRGSKHLHYLVLEYVEGGDVETRITETGPEHPPQVAAWGQQAALGLAAAHRAGVIHRDVKPSNLLLSAAGTVKVADFGLARLFDSVQTPHPALVGSLQFLAPEQLGDPRTVGPAADCYGLGCSLFWMLTGHLPSPEIVKNSDFLEYLRSGTPKRLREISPLLPVELDQLFARMLARKPSERPSLEEVAKRLGVFAAPTTLPAVASRIFLTEDATEVESLQAAIRELEIEAKRADELAAAVPTNFLNGLKFARDTRPNAVPGHGKRIAQYAMALGKCLAERPGWAELREKAHRDELGFAAEFHDLGTLGLESYDPRVQPTTASEAHTLRQIPIFARQMLNRIARETKDVGPQYRSVRDAAIHSSENWDGSGHPDAQAGEAIPPFARIVAVADAYDHARMGAEWEPGLGHLEALAEVARHKGTRFDPAVVEAFQSLAFVFESLFDSIPDTPKG